MLCKFCGSVNPDEVNFCGNCGKALRITPLPYMPGKRRRGIKIIITLLFLLTLIVYLLSLIFEIVSFEYDKGAQSLKEKIESIKEASSKEKTVDFHLLLTPQEIDGYLNEEFFNKNTTVFKAIHTRVLNEEVEIALSTDLLYIPTLLRIRISPERSGGKLTLFTSGISFGRMPVPSFLHQFLYKRYPYLNLNYLIKLSGVKLKEIKMGNNQIFIKGVWSI